MLGKPGLPNPLTISFRGQTLDDGADILRAIITECDDAGIPVSKIEADTDLQQNLVAGGYVGTVRLVACDELAGEIKIFA